MLDAIWPFFGISIRTPRLELRLITDDELPEFIELGRDIHDDSPFPFVLGWSTLADPEFSEGFAQFHWRTRGTLTPQDWVLPFGVFVDGVGVGLQAVEAKNFRTLRVAETGSWLSRRYQRQGIGVEMRAAALHFIFEGLGAAEATSTARTTNAGSIGVSTALGYEVNGTDLSDFNGEIAEQFRFRLKRAAWEESKRGDIELTGVEGCLRLLGLEAPGPNG